MPPEQQRRAGLWPECIDTIWQALTSRHGKQSQHLNRPKCEAMDIGALERYQRPLPVMNEYDQLLVMGGVR